ncbi:MAG: TauD/TfdA family dioxygenase [Paracoccaceae bacterium]|nr:TauD/TfdA family dioxygenase [Paracoccaceae bacterium]
MTLAVKPLTGALGAEIIGADIRREGDFQAIRDAFIQFSVIAIRGQDLSPEDHLAFARRWGEINVNRFFKPVPDHPEIAMVLKEPDQKTAIGESWHTDHSYDRVPAMGSILHALETPATGGDTMFVSMAAAWEGLSDGLKAVLKGLKAWHSSRHVFGATMAGAESRQDGRIGNADRAEQDALHPIVIRHPLSGREGLYVNPQFTTDIDGWSAEESAALLGYLYQHCGKPEYACRVRWAPGTVTMWDNRATWHKAVNDYHGQRRLMHRVTVEGVALEAAA